MYMIIVWDVFLWVEMYFYGFLKVWEDFSYVLGCVEFGRYDFYVDYEFRLEEVYNV